MTIIPIGKILQGAYVVWIDGQRSDNFEVLNEGTSDASIRIWYNHSTHTITISGTNVIPEFPTIFLWLAAAGSIVGVIAATRIIRRPELI